MLPGSPGSRVHVTTAGAPPGATALSISDSLSESSAFVATTSRVADSEAEGVPVPLASPVLFLGAEGSPEGVEAGPLTSVIVALADLLGSATLVAMMVTDRFARRSDGAV